jgi:hypothetical protein
MVYMLGNNMEAIALMKNQYLTEGSKHIDIYYYFICEVVRNGRRQVLHVLIANIVVDVMTKSL